MNAQNMCHLEGVVQEFPFYGANWSRCNPRGRYQVRFWLGVSRELAGDGLDLFLCAIEPRTQEELTHYTTEIRGRRAVSLNGTARDLQNAEVPGESSALVIFVAESCAFDGQEMHQVHERKPARQGKMAAAGDDSGDELKLTPQ